MTNTPQADPVERPDGAIDALTNYQQQADMHGEMVKVSRQALDETLAYIATLETRIAHMTEAAAKLVATLTVLSDHFASGYGDETRHGVIGAVEQIARSALQAYEASHAD